MLNDYNNLAPTYQKTNEKPDKKYSILPTVLSLVGDIQNKTVLDLGTGDGFFASALAGKNPLKVIGIDNSAEQIKLSNLNKKEEILEYKLGDIFKDTLPISDVVVAPFVLNYCSSVNGLEAFFLNIHKSLINGGRLLLVLDLPNGQNLKRFGAVKTLKGKAEDATPLEISLFNNETLICTLNAFYFTSETISKLLEKVGFTDVEWHTPIIDSEGIKTLGNDFWAGYVEDCELGYVTAIKRGSSLL